MATAEDLRLEETRRGIQWKRWGPYLSERQWGTVREDYSADGSAWEYFPHDQARSRAYHWGEDGLAGISDDKQILCFAIALWNGADPILKERLFGLTNSEGNHGEDVKEYYFYLDSTPTHSYMKYLYKYPHRAYPYSQLVETNRRRSRQEPECELLDTGIFGENRYFDVLVEYAKGSPEDVFIRIRVANRGGQAASIDVLPTLWFRNTWSWGGVADRPSLREMSTPRGTGAIAAKHAVLGDRWLFVEGDVPLLFTENETNNAQLFGSKNATPFVKDGIHEFLVHGRRDAVNPAGVGTKAATHHQLTIGPGQTATVRLRLTDKPPAALGRPFEAFDRTFDLRSREADAFYRSITPEGTSEDAASVMRQAFAGMLWSKQYYNLDVRQWLAEHGVDDFSTGKSARNQEWGHMVNDHVVSMPDKWEYPWYAAWDLAFHSVILAGVDVDFAKQQLDLLLGPTYMNPSGQMPAYEWNFSDVNPPVHPWAALFNYRVEQALRGEGDIDFLKRAFGKLLSNFAWWVNRKDRFGKNVYEGGFLGLDNIGVFDRSAPLPTGGHLEQADGTAWMALFCQNMLEIGVEVAAQDPTFEDLAVRFIDHFLLIARAMNRGQGQGMWDEEDGFYYDVLRRPDGSAERLKVRSMVGLLPLCATSVIEPWQRDRMPKLIAHLQERRRRNPELFRSVHASGPGHLGHNGRGMMAVVNGERLRRILTRMLDENEFLSAFGIRALSRYHSDNPYIINVLGHEYRVGYVPGDSDSGMFGGNSNWRGPIWMPVNALIIRALLSYYLYYGDSFRIECPTGSGRLMNLFEVAKEIAARLTRIFLPDEQGRRPVHGEAQEYRSDPHWRDLVLFYEYFNGETGAGVGASHQTGWTGLVATLIQLFGRLDGAKTLEGGKASLFAAGAARSAASAGT
jgi:hypothetical protein